MDNVFKRVEMVPGSWAVICLGRPLPDAELPASFDPSQDSGRGPELATRSGFATREDAAYFAATIDSSWRPMVARLEVP